MGTDIKMANSKNMLESTQTTRINNVKGKYKKNPLDKNYNSYSSKMINKPNSQETNNIKNEVVQDIEEDKNDKQKLNKVKLKRKVALPVRNYKKTQEEPSPLLTERLKQKSKPVFLPHDYDYTVFNFLFIVCNNARKQLKYNSASF